MNKILMSLTFATMLAMNPMSALGQAGTTNSSAPAPSLEQRVSALEAYIDNTDPSAAVASLKDKDGNLPKDFKMATLNTPGPGHNGWQMVSTALVLFMTLPGLALFYGGLVRRKNILSVMAQCFFIAGMVTILWWICGYSLVFSSMGSGGSWSFLGNLKFAFLNGVDSMPNTDYSPWVSQNVYAMYQLMFAIITPVLILGRCGGSA